MDTSSSKQRTILSFFQRGKNKSNLIFKFVYLHNLYSEPLVLQLFFLFHFFVEPVEENVVQLVDETVTDIDKTSKTGRKFRSEWKEKFTWIKYCERQGSVFCDLCCEAVEAKLLLPTDSHAILAKDAFVVNGYSNWSQGNRAFKNHEKSGFHKAAFDGLNQRKFGVRITKSMSEQQLKQMQAARIALDKIFDTALFIGIYMLLVFLFVSCKCLKNFLILVSSYRHRRLTISRT